MKYLAASLLLVALVGCGRDAPHLVEPKTTTTHAFVTVPGSATSTSLIASDASTPAAGTCGNAPSGGAAVITLNPDIPSPRCVIVHSLNQLTFVNGTDEVVTVNVGYDSATLDPHESHAFPQNLGDHWSPGVHRIDTGTLYAGSGPEVWLQD